MSLDMDAGTEPCLGGCGALIYGDLCIECAADFALTDLDDDGLTRIACDRHSPRQKEAENLLQSRAEKYDEQGLAQ